jgi:hypothetical protein
MKQLIAFAKIKNAQTDWVEDFEVSSKQEAKGEIQNVINTYNNSLQRGEIKRELVKILRYEEKEIEEAPPVSEWDVEDDLWLDDETDMYDFEEDEEYYD